MNKKYNLFFLFFLILFLIVTINAAQPVQVSTDYTGMQIDYPKYDYIKVGQSHRFHAHVINASSAKTNKTTSCIFHLYNQTGYDINLGSTSMEFEDYNGIDFALTINGKNFSTPGTYSYVIQCNSSNEIAFASAQLQVTPTGYEYPKTITFYIIIFAISLFFIVLGFSIKDAWVTMFGTFGLYFIGLYILINGITGIKDSNYSWPIGIIIIGVAAYISINSAREMLE